MTKQELQDQLKSLYACADAVAWTNDKTLEQAWKICKRGDWMLWYAAKVNYDIKQIVLAACACARLSLKYLPKDELRPLEAIETAEAWCRDEATIDEVRGAYASSAASSAAAKKEVLEQCADIVRKYIKF